MYFSGSVYHSQHTLFSRLIFPCAQVKKLLQRVYDFILQSIWTELISGKTIKNEVANLVLFFIFCLFSIAFFHLQTYRGILLVLFFSLWLIDRAIAQKYYQKGSSKYPVSLHITENKLYFKEYLPKNQTIDLEFNREQIKESAIVSRTLYSDGFQAEIKQCWQVLLFLQDGTEILVDEQPKPEKALSKAKKLATQLEIPIILLESEGNHSYATHELSPIATANSNTIQIELQNQQYHIYSQWRLQDSWQLLKQILVQSGFLLFVIISTNFMVRWGGFLNAVFIPFFNQQQTTIYLPSIWEILRFNLDIESYFEIGLAVGIIIFQGAKISRTQHIYLDQSLLKYYVGHQKQEQLKTADIEAIILIPEPNLMVLIVANRQALMIEHLPTPDAYRKMVEKIEFALNQQSVKSHP
ncbi:MAG: hypothetical protein GVY04_01905 [Cyanobacteria bacterium]|jgi:hypothetical protein|nr:hypothetical protein [Cyanobacteria bacterium GSL.Bin1]